MWFLEVKELLTSEGWEASLFNMDSACSVTYLIFSSISTCDALFYLMNLLKMYCGSSKAVSFKNLFWVLDSLEHQVKAVDLFPKKMNMYTTYMRICLQSTNVAYF